MRAYTLETHFRTIFYESFRERFLHVFLLKIEISQLL